MHNTFILLARINFPKSLARTYNRRPNRYKTPNPGIQKRLNVLPDSNAEDIDVDELETDFMSVGDVHRDYENELKHYKEKEIYWIVRQKYFKEPKVNFLSWNDKDQIRHLHQTDPEEWSIEKLSEAFPALPNTIQKIIKAKWQKQDECKIEKHDKAVENNWKLLRAGQLGELPQTLVTHLTKFSNRENQFVQLQKSVVSADNSKKSKINEFGSIIQSYERINNKIDQVKGQNNTTNTYNKSKSTDVTLDQLKEYGIHKTIKEDDKSKATIEVKDLIVSSIDTFVKTKYKTELVNVKETPSDLIKYPENITIPKEKYKKGFTYKINDCYYDDDGEFLYRVPGMY